MLAKKTAALACCKYHKKISKRLLSSPRVLLSVIILVFFSSISIYARNAYSISAEQASGYDLAGDIKAGSLVSADRDNPDKMVLASLDNADRLIGIKVDNGEALSEINTANKSAIATAGRAMAMISDIYGDIKKGDIIVLSAVNGVGAKAVIPSRQIGVAQDDFDRNSPRVISSEIVMKNGDKKVVHIGQIPIVVSIGSLVAENSKSSTGSWLQNLLESLAGKKLSDMRIAIAVFMMVVTLVIIAAMVIGSVRYGYTAIGRNPLAKPMIFQAFAQTNILVVLIALLGVTITYTVLRA